MLALSDSVYIKVTANTKIIPSSKMLWWLMNYERLMTSFVCISCCSQNKTNKMNQGGKKLIKSYTKINKLDEYNRISNLAVVIQNCS